MTTQTVALPVEESATTITLFGDRSSSASRKTFVIFGVNRGGTTMVAGVAKLCGLDIGENLPINLEDDDFNVNILKKAGISPEAHMISAIQRRNQLKNVWGWKFPRAIAYLEKIREHLVNPHLIVVFRDPIATSTREILSGTPAINAIELVQRLQLRNLQLVKSWQVPSLIASYEYSVQNPDRFVASLCEFMSVEAPSDLSRIRAFMRPGEYKVI